VKDLTVQRLLALDAQYTSAVNSAVAEDRDDLVDELAAEYPDVAAQIIREDAA
jgi:hypothetical protein